MKLKFGLKKWYFSNLVKIKNMQGICQTNLKYSNRANC